MSCVQRKGHVFVTFQVAASKRVGLVSKCERPSSTEPRQQTLPETKGTLPIHDFINVAWAHRLLPRNEPYLGTDLDQSDSAVPQPDPHK